VATPIGHSLIGVALARRLGVRSPQGTLAAIVAASLPDSDVILGLLLHGNAWKIHRQGTHTLGFALSAGGAAGFAGLISAGSLDGERDLLADALTGAALVASHVVIDRMPFPYFPTKAGTRPDRIWRNAAINWTLDAVIYGVIASRLITPRRRPA
jgi:membrane-bound metal-dependent hydrolase YbcI (DUF457 family)